MAVMPIIGIAAQLLPLLPGLVDTVARLIETIKRDPAASEAENKAVLDALSARLHETADAVDAVVLPRRQ